MTLTCDLDVLVERTAWEEAQTNVYKDGETTSSSFSMPAVATIGDSNIMKDNDTNNDDDDDTHATTNTTNEKTV